MQSLRRAALRSVASASRSVATTARTTSHTAQFVPATAINRRCLASTARFFSHTPLAASGVDGNADHLTSEPDVAASVEDQISGETSAAGNQDAAEAVVRDGETPYGLFIRNIIFEVNEDDLHAMFEKYGEVAKTAVARDARGLSRGYGFVWFNDQQAMNQAAAETNGTFWQGRRLQVAPRVRTGRKTSGPRPSEPTSSLYIGNIPYETTDAELNRIFRGLDNVTDVRVAVDRTTGWPRGFAHADFADVDSAVQAMKKLKGTAIGGRELRFDYSTPNSHGQGRSQA